MNKKISLGASIGFMAIVAAITFTITMFFSLNIFNEKIANVDERENLYKKIAEIDTYVRNQSLNEVDEENLLNHVASGYMKGLDDPYASYMTQEEYKYYQQESAGQLIGIGITARMDESGYILVVEVAEGSPAENAGIAAKDLIVKVDGADVISGGYSRALTKIKGEEGTKINLSIRRDGEDFDVEVTRKNVKNSTIEYRQIGKNGYIKISSFDQTTVNDFKYAMSDLQSKGVSGLLFDVRNNPGGLLDSVAEILDYLLPEGDLVSQTNKKKETKVLYTSDAECIELPMVVLMDGETASAAELFAADLKDFKVAELVGQNSFGKGIMQTAFPLEDGSAIKLTIAYYNPHSGVNYHGVGLKPDYDVALTTEQKLNFATLNENTDPQLKKALEVLSAKE